MKELGLRLNGKKSVLSPENHFSRCGVGSTTMHGSSHPRGSQESGSRPVTHCEAVSITAGSDGSCIQCDTFWSAVHETPTVVAQDQGGPVLGAPCRRVMLATDASLTGWGVVTNGHPARGLWRGHHPAWHTSCLEMLAMTSEARPFWGRVGSTAFHGACLSSVPSGDQPANPASAPGRSGLQRAHTSVSSARQCSGAGELATPVGVSRKVSLVSSCRRAVTGHRASSSHKSRGWSRETGSPSRLLAAWKLLPNVSAWVLSTVERGYRIQFSASPPPFNGVFPTVVSPEQGLVMEQEVDTLLRKEAIEVVPPQDRESGFYSWYFIVPKKDGGLRPILDLKLLNRSVMRLKFKMLAVNQVLSQIRSEDWFVRIDLKDAYFHVSILPQHRKFLMFAFRGEAYQYQVLPFGLALSPRTFTKCMDAALAPL
ncbi:Transposon Ty3-G Gag-Pol polyprotein [Labeo rohita]|uniref:ribonuclease H n=1 Tax=Labeo rohita TaxID=84645 RepID=A0ABQ8MN72_LABRO|nr:Transposon Ty3-G Gag-Pol polyprotein [Labeo rohita]